MWLFKIDQFHYCPLGNAGQMKTTNRSPRRIHACAKMLAGNERCKIYLMHDFTQKMCEMAPGVFEEYVEKHGKLILSQGDMGRDQQLFPVR